MCGICPVLAKTSDLSFETKSPLQLQGAFSFVSMQAQRKTIAIALTALLILVGTYWPGLTGGFFFDDIPNIVTNESIRINTLDVSSLRASISGPDAGPLGRPVSVLTFALTHYVFGLDPFAFKAINLTIHAGNGLLVAYFVFLLLGILQRDNQLTDTSRAWLASWVAAVWAVHPMNVVPVLLAVQRMTLLAGTFCLLALIAHLKATTSETFKSMRWGWLTLSWLVFWPLAILSKETGLLFPVFVFLITFFQPKRVAVHAIPRTRAVAILVTILFAIGIAMASHLGWNWLSRAYGMRSFTLAERLMTESRVLWVYAAQILIPDFAWFSLHHDDFPISKGFVQPLTTVFAIGALGLVTAGSVCFRARLPILCLGLAWFLGGHGLESTFLPLELVHEYRNYMPSIGLILALGWAGMSVVGNIKFDHGILTKGLVPISVIAFCALITWTRSAQLGDPLTGTQIEAERHPQSARANHAAAVALIDAHYGDRQDPLGAQSILYYLSQASKADPTFKLAPLSLVIWACASDRSVEVSWVDDLASRLATTPFGPQDMDIPLLLLRPLVAMPKCLKRDEVLRLFTAPSSNPKVANSLNARFLEAAADYELMVALSPQSARTFLQSAALLAPSDQVLIQKLNAFSLVDEKSNRDGQKQTQLSK